MEVHKAHDSAEIFPSTLPSKDLRLSGIYVSTLPHYDISLKHLNYECVQDW